MGVRFLLALVVSCYFLYCATTPASWHYIDFINLIFHEAGHSIFFFLGTFVQVLMGSGLQILLPLLIALYFWYTNERFGSGFALMWAGQNLVNVSVYAGDAFAMQLPLLGGDAVVHDWNYILSTLHLLSSVHTVALTLYVLGCVAIGLGALMSLLSAASNDG